MAKSGFTFEGSGRIDRIDRFATKKGGEIITLVVQVEGQFPQLVPIKFFSRMAEEAARFKVGDVVEITGRLGGRDWNGKVYGDNVAESIEAVATGSGEKKAGDEPPPSDDQDSIPF